MKPVLDLTRHAFMRELGDMVIFGTWIYNHDQEDTEPCLALTTRYRHPKSSRPCVIPLSSAYLYRDPVYSVRMARQFARALGFEDSMTRTHKIADAIYSHLDDLVRMPVDPQQTIVVGEATVHTPDGRKTVQLTDHEQIQQA